MEDIPRQDGRDSLPIAGLLGRAYTHTTNPVYAAVAAVAPEIRPAHGAGKPIGDPSSEAQA